MYSKMSRPVIIFIVSGYQEYKKSTECNKGKPVFVYKHSESLMEMMPVHRIKKKKKMLFGRRNLKTSP